MSLGSSRFELKIRFGVSHSANYVNAVRRAKSLPGFVPATEDCPTNSVSVRTEELPRNLRRLFSLWDMVGNWRSSELLLNDSPVELSDLHQFSAIIECSIGYDDAARQEGYCRSGGFKEGWGCRHLSEISRYDHDYGQWGRDAESYWFQFGEFTSDGLWKVDKARLSASLRREAEGKSLWLCSHFQLQKLDEIVGALPDVIAASDSGEWGIVYEEIPVGSEIERRAVGIAPRSEHRGTELHMGTECSAEHNEETSQGRHIPKVSFSDIGGIESIVQTVREVIELPLKRPDVLKHLGIRAHRGVLLHGPPGCGKTLIAKAIANETSAHFIHIKGPELLSKWHGESEFNLRSVFEAARDLQPSVVYFDEIDAVAQSRSSDESLRFDSRFVNQLLTLMDGVEDFGNVCVIASTNRPELLDRALLRPGRFDYSIEVGLPSRDGCCRIFAIQTRDMPLVPGFDPSAFAENLLGLTGADIAFVAREAAYCCLRRSVNLSQAISEDRLVGLDFGNLLVTHEDFQVALAKLRSRRSASERE